MAICIHGRSVTVRKTVISAVSQSLVDGVGGSTAVRSSWPAGALWNPIKLCYHQCPQERNTGGHGRSGRSSTGKSVTVPAGMLSQSADAAGRKRQANDVSHELLECEAGWLRPRRLGACCGRRRVRCGLGTRGCLGQPADRRCCGQAHPRKPMTEERRRAKACGCFVQRSDCGRRQLLASGGAAGAQVGVEVGDVLVDK